MNGKALALACVVVMLAQAVSASSKSKAASPAKTAAVALSSATARSSTEDIFVWKSTQPLTAETLFAHFDLFDRELKTMKAHFTQSLTIKQTGITQSTEGTVTYLKPDHLRIEHVKPERQTVVANGKDLWVYRHSQNQAIQSDLAEWKKADPMMNSLLQLGNYSQLLKTYDVQVDTFPAPVLTLRPKTGHDPFLLRLELARSNLFPAATELVAGEINVRTQLDGISLNPIIDAGAFGFTPPEGADVFRNFKPPQLSQ